MLLEVRRITVGVFTRKAGYRLFLTVLPDLEVIGCEVPNVVSLFVSDDGVDENDASVDLDRSVCILWRGRGRLLRNR